MTRAASMNSRSLRERIWERTARASPPQAQMLRIRARETGSFTRKMVANTSITGNLGMVSTVFVSSMRMTSSIPP